MGIEVPFLGLLLSLGFIALTGVYPGGIIVPSYLALFVDQPARVGGTLVAALLTFGAYRIAVRWLILFGRRRLLFMLLVGGLWAYAWLHLVPAAFPASLEFRVIGWLMPGLIANQLERQGVLLTGAALATVTILAGWIARLALLA